MGLSPRSSVGWTLELVRTFSLNKKCKFTCQSRYNKSKLEEFRIHINFMGELQNVSIRLMDWRRRTFVEHKYNAHKFLKKYQVQESKGNDLHALHVNSMYLWEILAKKRESLTTSSNHYYQMRKIQEVLSCRCLRVREKCND